MRILGPVVLLSLVGLQGCTSFHFDYAPPTGGDVAKLSVQSAWDGNNQRVIVHGANRCHPDDAKLAGLINAGAAGQVNVKQVDIVVRAGVEVALSIPQIDLTALRADAATFRYCQPVAAFVPAAGQSYKLVFGSCRADLFIEAPPGSGHVQPSPSRLDRSCVVTAESRGTDGKLFYLTDKPR
jgi:hypothetical protein